MPYYKNLPEVTKEDLVVGQYFYHEPWEMICVLCEIKLDYCKYVFKGTLDDETVTISLPTTYLHEIRKLPQKEIDKYLAKLL